MAAPVVRKSQLDRAWTWLQARGLMPAAIDALPGGGFRFHLKAPDAAQAAQSDETEKAAWDEALR